jgi:hypothetical protein
VIDEQNPASDACAWNLVLENVMVAGSLAGNVATDPAVNARVAATMFGAADASTGGSVLQRTSEWAGDVGAQQSVTATGLTITHSATRGLALQSAYTDWEMDGGLLVSYCGQEGIRTQQIGSSSLTVLDSSGVRPNVLRGNLGGAVVNVGNGSGEVVTLSQCMIVDNSGALAGGVGSFSATTVVRNSVLMGNQAASGGGAMAVTGGSLAMECCTVVGNRSAGRGGAAVVVSGVITVANSILWDNGPSPISGSVVAMYSNVQGGYPGAGNIDRDPRFADAAGGNCHLQRSSPCVNAGDPAFAMEPAVRDMDGEQRLQGGFVDMGADETPYWDGDADHDGDVDGVDVGHLLACLRGPDAEPVPVPPLSVADCLDVFDFDEDGDVDVEDLAGLRRR